MEQQTTFRLTSLARTGGCAAKLSPVDLRRILAHLNFQGERDPNLLVGFETSDDAGVYRLTPDTALVQTLDFVTPLYDDPFIFGQIAAANALSDVFAMGGRPINAMNICCFPSEGVETSVLSEILQGGHSKVQEAGAVLLGGHTVKDQELKYGLSVTGIIHPDKILRNSTSKPGDKLVITKRIGTGVIVTGSKNDLISGEPVLEAMKSMATLNKVASETMLEVGVNACTDITGFGLAGHLCEMALGSKVQITINLPAIPVYPVSIELFGRGIRTGVTLSNKESVKESIQLEKELPKEKEMVLYDPQTSGPLVISVPSQKADQLVSLLRERGIKEATIIGEVSEAPKSGLFVRDSL
jgi:selenide, water dikinase